MNLCLQKEQMTRNMHEDNNWKIQCEVQHLYRWKETITDANPNESGKNSSHDLEKVNKKWILLLQKYSSGFV